MGRRSVLFKVKEGMRWTQRSVDWKKKSRKKSFALVSGSPDDQGQLRFTIFVDTRCCSAAAAGNKDFVVVESRSAAGTFRRKEEEHSEKTSC